MIEVQITTFVCSSDNPNRIWNLKQALVFEDATYFMQDESENSMLVVCKNAERVLLLAKEYGVEIERWVLEAVPKDG